MVRKKIKKTKKVINPINVIDAGTALKRINALPKAKFLSQETQKETEGIEAFQASSGGVTTEDRAPESTDNTFWRYRWEENRISGIQDVLEAQCTADILRLGTDLKQEIVDFKGNNLRFAIGTIVTSIIAIVICLAVYHFAAIKVIETDIKSDLVKDIENINKNYIKLEKRLNDYEKSTDEAVTKLNDKLIKSGK